jgi:hypothetical protein
MNERKVLFGAALGTAVTQAGDVVRGAVRADRTGLDLVTIPDHPYFGQRLDAYATLAFVLGRTSNSEPITGRPGNSSTPPPNRPCARRSPSPDRAPWSGSIPHGVRCRSVFPSAIAR